MRTESLNGMDTFSLTTFSSFSPHSAFYFFVSKRRYFSNVPNYATILAIGPFFSLPNPPACSDWKFNEPSAILQLHSCSTKHPEPHMMPAEISTIQINRLFMLYIHCYTAFFFRTETYFGHRFVSVLTCPKYNQTSQKQQGSWETQTAQLCILMWLCTSSLMVPLETSTRPPKACLFCCTEPKITTKSKCQELLLLPYVKCRTKLFPIVKSFAMKRAWFEDYSFHAE